MSPTLILSPRFTPDSNELWKAAIDAGWSVERLHSHRVPEGLPDREVVLYGEALFTNIVAEQLVLTLLEAPFRWLADLPYTYQQRDVHYVTLEAARKIAHPAFVKPAYDKSFESKVYATGMDIPSSDVLPDAMPVLIAEPVSWEIEFRCFILNRTIATLSVYLRANELAQVEDGTWAASAAEIESARDFAMQVLQDDSVSMPPAFVMDVGKITGRGWAVIEANPAWASGIYGCGPIQVLPVIQRACVKSLSDEDKRWVEQRWV